MRSEYQLVSALHLPYDGNTPQKTFLDHTAYGEPEVTWGSNYSKMNHMSN